MKRYGLFIGSFIVVYILLQWASGFLLTVSYTPDLSSDGTPWLQEVSFGQNSLSFVVVLISATIAYILSRTYRSRHRRT
ncbi:hypothetical protein [Guptibacillus algicola]|uniref:hypothetical protein n=1 Tax=Guptibacillus algicola TaxID=225844 RepID=UPI001CD2E91E|nr:hypothetical protein [Alkalihalobacillus algicola]MCA0987369.1 hypothetical protein [Alkalihalobacillus algicola]